MINWYRYQNFLEVARILARHTEDKEQKKYWTSEVQRLERLEAVARRTSA